MPATGHGKDYFGILDQINGMDLDGTSMYGTTVIGAQPVPVVHMYTQLSASYGTRWFTQFPEAPWDFTPTINSESNVAALHDWLRLYGASPPESINYLWFDAGTRFSQGDIGMFYHWTPYFYLVNNEGYLTGTPSPVVDKFETAVLPTMTAGGDQVVSLGGWSLGMPSTSANQDAAWQFIKWATGSDGQKAMGEVNVKGHQFADFSRKSNYEDADLNAIYPFLGTQLEMMKLGDGKVVRPPAPIYTSLEGVYGLQINQAMSGQVDAGAGAIDNADPVPEYPERQPDDPLRRGQLRRHAGEHQGAASQPGGDVGTENTEGAAWAMWKVAPVLLANTISPVGARLASPIRVV